MRDGHIDTWGGLLNYDQDIAEAQGIYGNYFEFDLSKVHDAFFVTETCLLTTLILSIPGPNKI